MTPRLYCPLPLGVGADVEVACCRRGTSCRARAARLGVASEVILFNGAGGEFAATIDVAGPRAVIVRVRDRVDVDRESPLDVTVVHGLASTDRMDYAMQKMVELGARRIVPVTTSRSVVQLDERRALKRVEHWRSIAIASCEQCGRNVVPRYCSPSVRYEGLAASAVGSCTEHPCACCSHPMRRLSLAGMAPPVGAMELLIGPEGGFTDEESKAAARCGFHAAARWDRVSSVPRPPPLRRLAAEMNAPWGDWR